MSNKCALCDKKIKLLATHVIKGKHLCVDCYMKEMEKGDYAFLNAIPNFTITNKYINRVRQDGIVIDENSKKIAFFRYREAILSDDEKLEEINKRVKNDGLSIIEAKKQVEEEQRAYIVNHIKYLFDYDVFLFDNILEVELLENGHKINSKRRQYIENEKLLKEIHYGEIEDFLGFPVTKEKGIDVAYQLGLKIVVNSWTRPVFYIDFFNKPGSEIKKESDIYMEIKKEADYWYDFIENKLNDFDTEDLEENLKESNDFYDTLMKLDKLRKAGVLTEDEFKTKKTEILDKI
ncbi:MAG: SHOCT domain-containing protein [Tissierellales bacterium]|nr:SHOCT domain-containing protein [Tissierellales bacterium]